MKAFACPSAVGSAASERSSAFSEASQPSAEACESDRTWSQGLAWRTRACPQKGMAESYSPSTHYLGWKSSPTSVGNGKNEQTTNTSHRTPSSLTGLPSRRKRGHYASEGTFGRQVITMGPYGSLETGNTTTRMVTLRRWVGVAWRAQLGSLIIE